MNEVLLTYQLIDFYIENIISATNITKSTDSILVISYRFICPLPPLCSFTIYIIIDIIIHAYFIVDIVNFYLKLIGLFYDNRSL